MSTPNYGIPTLVAGQEGAEALFNAGVQLIDAVMQLAVESRTVTAEPGSPTNGQIWLVPASATGTDWLGQDGKLAFYYDGWTFIPPVDGTRMWVRDEGYSFDYDGTNWLGDELVMSMLVNELGTVTTGSVLVNGLSTTGASGVKIPMPDGFLWMSSHFGALHANGSDPGDWTLTFEVDGSSIGTAVYELSATSLDLLVTNVVNGTPISAAAGEWGWDVAGPSSDAMIVQILLKLRRA